MSQSDVERRGFWYTLPDLDDVRIPVNRADFQKLSRLRIKEAKALLDGGLYSGAYYLAGYAVECALKACIAKLTKEHDFPDREVVNKSWSHRLSQLVEVAGLEKERNEKARLDKEFELR